MNKKLLSALILLIKAGISFSQTNFTVRADGAILKDSKPFFPMGFYVDRGSIASYNTQVTNLALSGAFNVVDLPYVGGDQSGWTSFLDLCLSKKIYVESQLYYDAPVFEPVDLYKSHGATFSWSIADDADNGYFTLDQLKDRNAQCKAKDPNHLSFITLTGYYLGRRNLADNYTNIADANGYQCYPINPPADYDVTSNNALSETYLRILLYVQSAAKYNKPMILNAQNFSWGAQSTNPRFPTVAEVRNTTYTGLAAGVKGIISYVYNSQLVNQTALWNEIKFLGKDVQTLHELLLEGKLTRNSSASGELVSSYWELGDTCLVVLANTTYSKDKIVSQTMPLKYSNHYLAPVFGRLPVKLSYKQRTISGTLKTQEVQVYKLLPNITTSIESENSKSIVILHPNPAKTVLYLSGNILENVPYEITSIEGKSLQTGIVMGGSVPIENFKTGLYLIKIETDAGETAQRFVKE